MKPKCNRKRLSSLNMQIMQKPLECVNIDNPIAGYATITISTEKLYSGLIRLHGEKYITSFISVKNINLSRKNIKKIIKVTHNNIIYYDFLLKMCEDQ